MTLAGAAYWAIPIVGVFGIGWLISKVMRADRSRPATRKAADMDHAVHERIREISAESRFSSAGIEF